MTPPLIAADAVAIGVGAFFGAMSRYQAGRMAADLMLDSKWHGWHTAAINVGGSFVLGGVTGAPVVSSKSSSVMGLTPRQKLLMGVGFCGSFTTFSTYSVDLATWISQGKVGKAAAYVLTNNVGGIAAAATGLWLAQRFL